MDNNFIRKAFGISNLVNPLKSGLRDRLIVDEKNGTLTYRTMPWELPMAKIVWNNRTYNLVRD